MKTLANALKNGWPTQLSGSPKKSWSAQDIHSCYQVAMAIVSKVDEIDDEKKKRILVADDEALVFDLIEEFLGESNIPFELMTALNGEKAYELAVAQVPDLIITDWLMPSMDGLELIKQLRSNLVTREIPVIITTGAMTPPEIFNRVFAGGAVDYIRKPIHPLELVGRVRTALALDESMKMTRRLRAAVDVNHQFVSSVIDAAANPIFYQDKWGRFLGCNSAFESLVGRSKADIVGKSAGEFLPAAFAGDLDRYFVSLTDRGVVHKFDMMLARQEGRSKELVLSYIEVGNESGELIIGSFKEADPFEHEVDVYVPPVAKAETEWISHSAAKFQDILDFWRRELSTSPPPISK